MSDVPGEVTLLCIGPLTNVALAIRLDPNFLTKLKNLVVMGGSVEGKCSAQNSKIPDQLQIFTRLSVVEK